MFDFSDPTLFGINRTQAVSEKAVSAYPLFGHFTNIVVDPAVSPGKAWQYGGAVLLHPRDYLQLRIEMCPTSYERKCTMRGRVRYLERRWHLKQFTGLPAAHVVWPELAAWAGVPER